MSWTAGGVSLTYVSLEVFCILLCCLTASSLVSRVPLGGCKLREIKETRFLDIISCMYPVRLGKGPENQVFHSNYRQIAEDVAATLAEVRASRTSRTRRPCEVELIMLVDRFPQQFLPTLRGQEEVLDALFAVLNRRKCRSSNGFRLTMSARWIESVFPLFESFRSATVPGGDTNRDVGSDADVRHQASDRVPAGNVVRTGDVPRIPSQTVCRDSSGQQPGRTC